jgi:hypothetical protein
MTSRSDLAFVTVQFTAEEWAELTRERELAGGAAIVLRKVLQLTKRPELTATLPPTLIGKIASYLASWSDDGTYQKLFRIVLGAVKRARAIA